MTDRFAFDRASVRSYDSDGRLHVAVTHISKANICPYRGAEIPDAEALGLDPDRVYQLLRDPAELAKAAPTFNNIPLLSRHVPVSVDDPQKEIVVGSTGTDAAFDAPYLDNSLVVWDAVAIAGIESGEQKELSCAYRYRADMTPGSYEGVPYDGVMRNIRGNHVALVEQGRAGSDVVVGDSKEISMPKIVLSRKAALAKGALAVFLKPKLAQDAKLDLTPLLVGVNAANWGAKKAAIVAGIKAATKGKLAQDADVEDVVQLLDSLDGDNVGPDDDVARDNADQNLDGAADASPVEAVLAMLKGKISDEDYARVEEMLRKLAADDADGDGDEEELLAKLKELLGAVKPGQAQDEPAGAAAAPATSATPEAPTKAAMDAAISKARKDAVAETMQRMRAIAEAEEIVRPIIGKVTVAQDSAEAIYRLALDAKGVDVTGVHPSAYKAMVQMLPKAEAAAPAGHRVAMDAAAVTGLNERFPGATRVKQLG